MTLSVILLLCAVAVVLVIWGVSVQNGLVRLDEFCQNSLRQINVQQISRFDLIKSMVKLAREYAGVESENLQKIIASRTVKASAAPSPAEVRADEAFLSTLQTRLVALSESYPELKANENYTLAMENMKQYEENVRLSRMTYNDSVTNYNNKVRMFPSSLIAGLLHFGKREYLEEDRSKTDFPEV